MGALFQSLLEFANLSLEVFILLEQSLVQLRDLGMFSICVQQFKVLVLNCRFQSSNFLFKLVPFAFHLLLLVHDSFREDTHFFKHPLFLCLLSVIACRVLRASLVFEDNVI